MKSHWFSGIWSVAQSSLSIAYKDLFPIVVAAYLWGPQWVSQWVEFFCDNESVVAVRKSGTSWDKSSMVLLCYLTMLAIHHSFSFTVSSVQGKANPVADPLSIPISAVKMPGFTCRPNPIPDSCLPSGSSSDQCTDLPNINL